MVPGLVGGQVLDRRLSVDPGQQQAGQQPRRPRLQALARLPVRPVQVGARQPVETGEEAGRRRRRPQALQQQVVQAEGDVERGVAVPGALGVEKHRAAGPDEDVLGAHVAVHQGEPRLRRRRGEAGEARAQVGVPLGGGEQVGLEADGVEDAGGVEAVAQVPAAGGCAVNRREPGAHLARRRFVRVAPAELRLPQRVVGGIEETHDEAARPGVLGDQRRYPRRVDAGRLLHPRPFVAAPLDRDLPHRVDLEAGEGPLDADRPVREVDAPDVRRHAAGQRARRRRLVLADELQPAQGPDDGWVRFRHGAL